MYFESYLASIFVMIDTAILLKISLVKSNYDNDYLGF